MANIPTETLTTYTVECDYADGGQRRWRFGTMGEAKRHARRLIAAGPDVVRLDIVETTTSTYQYVWAGKPATTSDRNPARAGGAPR